MSAKCPNDSQRPQRTLRLLLVHPFEVHLHVTLVLEHLEAHGARLLRLLAALDADVAVQIALVCVALAAVGAREGAG